MSRRRRAMTLVEVVLAVSIVTAMMGGVYVFYTETLAGRVRITAATERIVAERAVMERITAELRAGLAFRFLNIGLLGGEDGMEFMTAVVPGPAVWIERVATEQPPPPEYDLQLIGYRLRTVEDADGEMVVEGLERTCQKVQLVRTAEEGEEIQTALLTAHVKFLRLRYFGESGWTTAWTGGDELPAAVEITLGFEPLPAETEPEEYPYESFRRVVYVPSGVQLQAGAIVRGLSGRGGL